MPRKSILQFDLLTYYVFFLSCNLTYTPEIRFWPGDIVEALQGGGCSELGIVDSTPPTTQQYEHYAEKAPQWFFMDYTDDAYTIYYLGDGDTHGHSECTDVFPPSKPVSKSIEKRLRDKLTEMQKLHGDE